MPETLRGRRRHLLILVLADSGDQIPATHGARLVRVLRAQGGM